MSINGSPSPPLSPVHNNFDSRIIIAFLKQVSPKKIYYPGTTISNRFFLRIGESFVFFLSQLRPLLLYFLFFFSISFNCEILFFFFSLATISPLYLFFLRFQRLITFFFVPCHDLFHFQSSFSTTISFLSLFPDRSSLYTRAKSGQRILPLLNRIYLPSIPSTIPFISLFPHVRENEK